MESELRRHKLAPVKERARTTDRTGMRREEGEAMGLGASEVVAFATGLNDLEGVTGVWSLCPSEREVVLWVTVRGFDEKAALNRAGVYGAIEGFITEHRAQMPADLMLDYFVLVDDAELGEPQIPATAAPVAA